MQPFTLLAKAGIRRARCAVLPCSPFPPLRSSLLHTSAVLAQVGGAKKKPAAGGGAAAPVEKYDLTKQIPVNLMKEGEEPVYRKDEEYPPWLWALLEEKPLLDDLLMKGVENLTQPELKRILRATSKRRIKTSNTSREKATGE
jgi:hypothetical protein